MDPPILEMRSIVEIFGISIILVYLLLDKNTFKLKKFSLYKSKVTFVPKVSVRFLYNV